MKYHTITRLALSSLLLFGGYTATANASTAYSSINGVKVDSVFIQTGNQFLVGLADQNGDPLNTIPNNACQPILGSNQFIVIMNDQISPPYNSGVDDREHFRMLQTTFSAAALTNKTVDISLIYETGGYVFCYIKGVKIYSN